MTHDIDIMARTLYGEAKAGDKKDAEAIACVIINRCNLVNWPDTPAEVCMQPMQFSCWNHNDPNRARIMKASGKWFAECKKIAEKAIGGKLTDPTQRSTHYHTPAVKPKWSRKKTPVYQTDGHLFFNDIDTKPPATAREALDQARPLRSTGTVKGATVATGAAASVAAVGEVVEQVSPALPIVHTLTELMPWFVAGCFGLGMAYMLWRRFDDRRKGVR